MLLLRRLVRPFRRRAFPLLVLLTLLFPFLLETLVHRTKYHVPLPDPADVDAPFETGCREPDASQPREKAALVMLTRNKELEQAKHTVQSIERQFNRWFHYPIVFFNDEPWDQRFIDELNATVSGEARFEVIPQEVWSFPEWIDVDKAKASIKEQGERGIAYGGLEGYHHMCRFYSGHFYTLPALQEFEWYWRLEPDVDFMCAITYDPFVEMKKRGKIYGYTQALWEVTESCPSLFMEMSDWKESRRIPTNGLWKAMMQASWLPFPFRRFFTAPLRDYDRYGDYWSKCHYWSNFEIAHMEFFRGKEYQDLFEHLDRKGGFYYERWGDAPVHSLAVAMLVDPKKVHHFEDVGYRHDKFYQCPANAPGRQLLDSKALGSEPYFDEIPGGPGCRCECDGRQTRNHQAYCLNKLKQPVSRERPSFSWLR